LFINNNTVVLLADKAAGLLFQDIKNRWGKS